MFKGYKTYITGLVSIVTVVGMYLTGDMALAEALQGAFTAVLAMTVRHGISTTG